MTTFINLSSILKVKPPIPDGIGAFVQLCNQYSSGWASSCSKTLFGQTNYLWVLTQFYSNQKMINDYKLGKISSDIFLGKLLDIFSFLKNNPKVSDPKALLSQAWTSRIELDAQASERLTKVIEESKNDTVVLIANTNPLDVEKACFLMNLAHPELAWFEPEATKITDSLSLETSYTQGLYKEGTPGLIKVLGEKYSGDTQIKVVSQFSGDLEMARKLGFNAQTADEFFNAPKLGLASRVA